MRKKNNNIKEKKEEIIRKLNKEMFKLVYVIDHNWFSEDNYDNSKVECINITDKGKASFDFNYLEEYVKREFNFEIDWHVFLNLIDQNFNCNCFQMNFYQNGHAFYSITNNSLN